MPAPMFVPRWRNRETLWIWNPLTKSSYGFESRPRHHHFNSVAATNHHATHTYDNGHSRAIAACQVMVVVLLPPWR